MVFTKVPKQIQVQIQKLLTDSVFLQRFDNDKVLDQLDQLKYNPFIQYNQLQLLFHNSFKVRHGTFKENIKKTLFQKLKDLYKRLLRKKQSPYIQLKPITLGLWGFLYTIKSPIIFLDKKWSKLDIDIFFYLLETKNFHLSLSEIVANSANYCQNVLHFTEQETEDVFQKLIKISFRVLNMFPKYTIEENQPAFNVDWMTSIATKVAQVSSYSTQEIYKDVPICETYYLFAQFCREKGSEAIYLRTEEQILAEEDLRTTTLLVERLIELKVLEEKDKEFYINIIHNQEME